MSDKVFTKKMTLSICLIILCLCALSISAGAFFSDTAKTGAKTFSTATYDLTIAATKQVTDTDPAATAIVTVEPNTADPHIYTLDILPEPDKDEGYSVKVSIKEGITATSSGYCKIVITDKTDTSITYGTYYTKQIAIAEHASADIKTFRQLKIKTEKDIVVTFIPLWGTYSGDDALADGAVITIPANNP